MTAEQPPAIPAEAEIRQADSTVTAGIQTVSSEALLRGGNCVFIRHGDALYALRATRNGKLILTK